MGEQANGRPARACSAIGAALHWALMCAEASGILGSRWTEAAEVVVVVGKHLKALSRTGRQRMRRPDERRLYALRDLLTLEAANDLLTAQQSGKFQMGARTQPTRAPLPSGPATENATLQTHDAFSVLRLRLQQRTQTVFFFWIFPKKVFLLHVTRSLPALPLRLHCTLP